MIVVKNFHTCAIEIYHMQSKYWYYYYSSKSERNEAAVVMQIKKIAQIKYETNTSQRLKKKYWWYINTVSWHKFTIWTIWISLPFCITKSFFRVENSQNISSSAPIRFMCEGIVASIASYHFAFLPKHSHRVGTLKLTIKSKDILRGAMCSSGRCESHLLLSHAQIIVKSARRVSESVSGRCEYTSYFELSVSVRCESGLKGPIHDQKNNQYFEAKNGRPIFDKIFDAI